MWNLKPFTVTTFAIAISTAVCLSSCSGSVDAFAPLWIGRTVLTRHYANSDPSSAMMQEALENPGSPLWRVGSAQVNIPEKYLIMYNFTMDNSNTSEKEQALRIGRLKVHWDNFWYTTRTFDVELDDVEALLEFTNMKLTESNWDELQDMDFYEWLMADVDEKGIEYEQEGFLHFSSIDLSGNLTLQLSSRPLGKDFGSFTLDLDTLDGLNKKIGALSEENLRVKKRRGVTFAELSDMMKEEVNEIIKSYMPSFFSRNAK